MTQRMAILVLTFFSVSQSQVHAGPPADIPWETLIAKCDLIVTGKVTGKKGPEKRLLKLPHADAAVELQCSDYQFSIDKILWSREETFRGKNVTVVAYDVPPAPDLQVPQLKNNESYLLLLQKMPDKAGAYYLPGYYKHYGPATDEQVRAVQQAISGR